MAIERLLGEIPPRRFLDDYFHRLPFSLPNGAEELRDRADWSVVEAILAQPGADALVVKDGERWGEDRVPAPEEARRLFDDGYTILVRHAERHDERLAELAADFARDFHAPVDVHLYCTPAAEHGFGWHYDAEDVFILQTTGRKSYSLRKNTVNPWPVVETLPADMKYERELMPLLQCLLAAGDWLYIPHGYWHMARAEEDAISLAIGVLSPTGLSVYDELRASLVPSMLWRQRLPVTGEANAESDEQRVARLREHFAQLADDLKSQLEDEAFARRFLACLRGER